MTNKDEWAKVADDLGRSEQFERLWAEFQEFKKIVEDSAVGLGLTPGTPKFSLFGMAMLRAKEHGEYEALEGLLW